MKFPEFKVVIAVYAGIWSHAQFIGGSKLFHDLLTELIFIVEDIKAHAKPSRHAPGILCIVKTAAGPAVTDFQIRVLSFIEFHGASYAFQSFFFCKESGYA